LSVHHFQTSELATKSKCRKFISFTFPLSRTKDQKIDLKKSSPYLMQSANGSQKLMMKAKGKPSPALFLSFLMMAKLVTVIKVSSNLSHLKPTTGKRLKAILEMWLSHYHSHNPSLERRLRPLPNILKMLPSLSHQQVAGRLRIMLHKSPPSNQFRSQTQTVERHRIVAPRVVV
jgi:hypothetical protein